MAIIMIACPFNGSEVSTGIEVSDVDQLPRVTVTTICPACGGRHEWTKDQAWLSDGGDQYRSAAA